MGVYIGSRSIREVMRNWTMLELVEEEGDASPSPSDLEDTAEPYGVILTFTNGSGSGGIVGIGNGTGNRTTEENKRDEDLAKIEMAILALIFILTVLGNCVVLLGIFFRRQKMTRMYYFILHLSVADLITAFFNVLTQLFWEITYRFQGGNILCKFVKYTQILGPYSSSWVLVVTALDRYQAICYPLSNCTWTAKRSKIMLGVAWSISLLLCVPQIFIFSYQIIYDGTWECWATFPAEWVAKAYVTWYSVTVFIVPLIILVFAYGCITRAIWINFNMKAASRNHDNYERRITRQDSDDGEESVFQRENSRRANASHVVQGSSGGSGKKTTNMNLYTPSKYFLTSKMSTTSTSSSGGHVNIGGDANGNRKYRNFNGKTRASTSSCTTQSTTLSPSLSGRRMSHDDKNSSPQPLLHTSTNGGGRDNPLSHNDEEQLHLIPKDVDLRITSTGDDSSPSSLRVKNGSVKFPSEGVSGNASDMCQHGCPESRCNFCHHHNHNHSPPERDHIEYHKQKSNSPSPTSTTTSPPIRTESQHFVRKSSGRHGFLSNRNRFSRRRGGSLNEHHNHRQSTKSQSMQTYVTEQPRTHSVKGISRAKIKTIKLTVTIICCYIFCSSPFIAAQLWSVYDPHAHDSAFFKGPTFTILTLLASLNSCVNPYIFLFFNPNLLENCFRGIFRPKFPTRRFNNGGGGSPLSRTLSQNKNKMYGVGNGGTGNATTASNSTTASFNRNDSLLRRPPMVTPGKGVSVPNPHLTPLIRDPGETPGSGEIIPVGNGYSKGSHLIHMEKLSERNESSFSNHSSSNAGIAPELNSESSSDTPGGSQLCRVGEQTQTDTTTTVMMNSHHNIAGGSSLIS